MASTNKEFQLANDLMKLQKDYNVVVRRNLELRSELEALSLASRKELMEHEREVSRLQELLSRAKMIDAPSATVKRRKKVLVGG